MKFSEKNERGKESARRAVVCRRGSEGAFVLAVQPSVRPRVERSLRWLARSSRLERARTRVEPEQTLVHFPSTIGTVLLNRTRARGLISSYPRPILRAPHDVADVLYYRLTKVMWRRLAAGARRS